MRRSSSVECRAKIAIKWAVGSLAWLHTGGVVANLCVHVPIEVACAFSHGPLLELFRTLVINCAVERNISELLIIRRRRAEQHKTTCSAHSDSRIHCQVAYYGTQIPNENLQAFPNRMHTPRLRTRYLKQHRFSGAYLPTYERISANRW